MEPQLSYTIQTGDNYRFAKTLDDAKEKARRAFYADKTPAFVYENGDKYVAVYYAQGWYLV